MPVPLAARDFAAVLKLTLSPLQVPKDHNPGWNIAMLGDLTRKRWFHRPRKDGFFMASFSGILGQGILPGLLQDVSSSTRHLAALQGVMPFKGWAVNPCKSPMSSPSSPGLSGKNRTATNNWKFSSTYQETGPLLLKLTSGFWMWFSRLRGSKTCKGEGKWGCCTCNCFHAPCYFSGFQIYQESLQHCPSCHLYPFDMEAISCP